MRTRNQGILGECRHLSCCPSRHTWIGYYSTASSQSMIVCLSSRQNGRFLSSIDRADRWEHVDSILKRRWKDNPASSSSLHSKQYTGKITVSIYNNNNFYHVQEDGNGRNSVTTRKMLARGLGRRLQREAQGWCFPGFSMVAMGRGSTDSNTVHTGTHHEHRDSHRSRDNGDAVRDELLEKALDNVPRFGWTRQSVEAAAVDLSLSKACAGAIKPAEIVHYFNSIADGQLEQALLEAGQTPEWKYNKTLHEKLAFGVNKRLELVAPYKNTWSSALATQSYHDQAPMVLTHVERMLSSMWAFANGEEGSETDMTWYTKRIILGAIVQAAEVYMLTDDSPNLQDTKAFVERGLSFLLV